jgi:hypothetical protein
VRREERERRGGIDRYCSDFAVSLCLVTVCAFAEMGFSATVCKKKKSGDVYFNYTTLMVGFTLDSTKIEWSLDSSATWADY